MPAAYILQSKSTGKFYIGSAEDLPSRLPSICADTARTLVTAGLGF